MSRVLWEQHAGRAHFHGSLRAVLIAPLPKVWLSLLLEPRDLWVGVYWKRPEVSWPHAVDIYVCLLPCLPLVVRLRLGTRAQEWRALREAWWAWRRDEAREMACWDEA